MASTNGLIAKLLGLTLLVLGFAGMGFGGWNGWQTWQTVQAQPTVTGQVISLKLGNQTHTTKRLPDGTRVKKGYVPEVEYEVDGVKHRIVGSVSSSPAAYKVGDTVTVRYPADHPEEGHLSGFMENWLVPIIFFAPGFVLSVFGWGIVRPKNWVPKTV